MRKLLPLLVVYLITAFSAASQCASGYNQAMLNWQFLEFFPSGGHGTYTSLATSQTQTYMFGGQKVTLTHTYTGSNAPGESADHTGNVDANYSAEDLQFILDGSVTFTFQNAVQNVRFSLYDIDVNQRVTVTAANGITAQPVTLSTVSGTTLAINSTVATAPFAQSNATVVALTSNDGTVHVDIPGPVTSFKITVASSGTDKGKDKEDGSLWLSNVLACTPTVTLPTNYFQVSKPFPNQPGYVLAVRDNSVYYVDPATGKAKFIFTDPGHTNINSMAYDPVNHMIYYVYSLTGTTSTTNPNNKILRRYDYNMDTFGVVLNDVTTLGIPTLNAGVESGAAAFYNGSLYLGIESNTYESVVWKVDFNGLQQPVSAAQQYGIGPTHDWADIGVSNGVLYDFDGAATNPDYFHMNLLTGAVTPYASVAGYVPKQTAVDWNDQVYDLGGNSSNNGQITPYLYNGSLNTAQQKAITYYGVAETGSWGDAAEAFKPKADFGDAPASYDPDPLSPALHEVDPSLKLGTLSDNEWNKPASPGSLADQDGGDEDGLPFVTILNNGGNYQTNVKVFNNTGANATVCAWVDFNNNGTFETGEGINQTVTTNASEQTLSLFWENPGVNLPDNSYTYIRIRVTSAVNGMTTANPTGFFDNGEVEDYRVLVNSSPLAVKLTDFEAKKTRYGKVDITWIVADEEPGTKYELEKGSDGQKWSVLYSRSAQVKTVKAAYESNDPNPYNGNNYYRLKITRNNGSVINSAVKKVVFEMPVVVQITPNPSSASAHLTVQSGQRANAYIRIVDMNGRSVYERSVVVEVGLNGYALPVSQLLSGVYHAEVGINAMRYTQQLIVNK